MTDLGRKTPVMVLSEDRTEQVIQILKRVFDTGREGLGDFYERMRVDTLSIQNDMFKDMQMLSAEEAARAFKIDVTGMTPLDLA